MRSLLFSVLAFFIAVSLPTMADNIGGSANQVIRIPSTGGRPKAGSINLGASAAVGTSTLGVANGGTGDASLTNHAVLIGAGTSAVTFVSPGSLGNILQSDGTNWQSAASSGVPTGTIISFAGQACATGYLITDGSAVSRTTFSTLFTVIGTTWGVGDGSTTFNVPDLRGTFERMIDDGATRDPDRYNSYRTSLQGGTHNITATTTSSSATLSGVSGSDILNVAPGMAVSGTGIPANAVVGTVGASSFTIINGSDGTALTASSSATGTMTLGNSAGANYVGSYQADQVGPHTHTYTYTSNGQSGGGGGHMGENDFPSGGSFSVPSNGTSETRTKNVYVLKCIKF